MAVRSLPLAGLSYKKSACQFHPFEPNNWGEIAELDSIHGPIGLSSRVDSHFLKAAIFTFSLLVGLVDFLQESPAIACQ